MIVGHGSVGVFVSVARNKILELNSFSARDLGEAKADRICAALIKDSESAFGFTSDTFPHAEEPLLTTYGYVKLQGTVESSVLEERVRFCEDMHDISKDQSQMSKLQEAIVHGAGSSSSGEGGLLHVKTESPLVLELKEKLTVLKSGKVALEKLLNAGLDLNSAMVTKAKSDPALQAKAEEMKDGIGNDRSCPPWCVKEGHAS